LAADAHPGLHRRDDRGGVIGRIVHHLVARQHVLLLLAVRPPPPHARPLQGLPTASGVAHPGFRARPSVKRFQLRVMTAAAQRGDFLDEHLLGFAPQPAASQLKE